VYEEEEEEEEEVLMKKVLIYDIKIVSIDIIH